jgi:hypothetical protein
MQQAVLEEAFDAYRKQVASIIASGDWGSFADLFTEDAVYRRRGYADFVGRESIRTWIREAMTTFPGSAIVGFEVVWRAFDATNAQVVHELRNVMRDPGDGSVHAASTLSLLTYAGDGLWSKVDDIQNPLAYSGMLRSWLRVSREHGTLDSAGVAYLAAADL